MPDYATIVIALIAVSAFFWMATALSRAAQPLRLQLAELGENLLADSTVPPSFKTHIKFMLNHAFTMRRPMYFAIIFVPIMAIIYVFRLRWLSKFNLDEKELSPSVREDFIEMNNLHNKITLANHPLLAPFVSVEITIFMSAAMLLRSLIKGAFSSGADAKTVMLVLERSPVMMARLSHSHAA